MIICLILLPLVLGPMAVSQVLDREYSRITAELRILPSVLCSTILYQTDSKHVCCGAKVLVKHTFLSDGKIDGPKKTLLDILLEREAGNLIRHICLVLDSWAL